MSKSIIKIKMYLAGKFRSWAMRLTETDLIIVPKCENSDTLVGYLTAMAHKKGFKAWRA